MAIDFKSLFSKPQPQPITTQVGAAKGPVVSSPTRGAAKGPVISSPTRPQDLFTRPTTRPSGTKPASAGTTKAPSNFFSSFLSRLNPTTRQGLGNWLGSIAPSLPGPLGGFVSRMAKACSYGGGDQDLGATKLPILPG